MSCKVEQLIREGIPSLEEEATVGEAAGLMATRNVGSCVVTHHGAVSGLFTERDLLTRVVAEGRDPSVLTLGEVCSRKLVSVAHDSTCQEAVTTMRSHRCQRLFVYRGERFLGLVKLSDLAYAMASRGPQTNVFVNVLGAATFAVAVGVIAMLLLQLPALVNFTGLVSLH
jgi:signal-transduction protein with cAMP-binding, CBS, and nucleotidyltransferase domain